MDPGLQLYALAFWVAQLVRAPARRAEDPGFNPGPGENVSLKLTMTYYVLEKKKLVWARI